MADALEGEWELCNDEGFVYKRRKRTHAAAPSLLVPDPDAELHQRQAQKKKKKILIKLRDQYITEIQQWEALSATLKQIKEKTQPPPPLTSSSSQESALQSLGAPEEEGEAFRPLIDELLLQAEAQEAFIQDMSDLCDVAETICKAEEERLKQPFIDLPVWATPHTLMASLSEVVADGGYDGDDNQNA